MKVISPRVHGYLDYLAVIVLLLAPSLFDFSENAAMASYIAAGGQFLYSIITDYPLGLFKAISFRTHAGIELAVSLLLIAAPWIAAFADDGNARNFFLVSGIGLFAVWLMTDYAAADHRHRAHGPLGSGPLSGTGTRVAT